MARRDGGFALVAVIWAIALLCVMALDVLAAARRQSGTAASLRERARLAAAADAGVALGVLALLGGTTAAQTEIFEGVQLAIGIEDETGKIDLNAASPTILRGLFESVGLPQAQAEALSLAVQDWRDTDEVVRPGGGAEARDYRLARSGVPPRDGAFQSVDEIAHVRGITPELAARLAPMLTVHSRQPQVDRRVASAATLAALGGGGPVAFGPAPGFGAALRVYTVRVEARTGDGRLERAAVVRLTGNPRDPYWIQQYR